MSSTHTTPRLQDSYTCPVCGQKRAAIEMLSGRTVRPVLLEPIQRLHKAWSLDQDVCLDCLNRARADFVESSLRQEMGELGAAESDVVEAIKHHELISLENRDFLEQRTFGERSADLIAGLGGSWTFIIAFLVLLMVWIAFNSLGSAAEHFDPYPYIFLNLVLSCLAALQAPIIMMSQNRQAAKDRAQAEADYKTNLKAELEIRHLHLKLDQLVSHQWHQLLEIQQIQMDMMNDLKKIRL